MKTRILLIALCVLIVSSGCQKSEHSQSAQGLITSDNYENIVGMQWVLAQMTVDGQAYSLVDKKPFIEFQKDGRVSGMATVNRFFGSASIDANGTFQWSAPLGSTRMAGPPQLMEQEDRFLQAMEQITRIRQDGIHLRMTGQDGRTVLVFDVSG